MHFLLVFFVGAPMWMCIVKFLAWVADFSVSWGLAYVIGFVIAFVMLTINYHRTLKPIINVRVRRK